MSMMSQHIIQFETAVLIVGFIVNLLIGTGIVLTGFTFQSRSVSSGAIISIILSATAIGVQHWIGRTYIRFDTFAQVESLTAVSIFAAAIGATLAFTTFEPQTPANKEVKS